MGGIRKIFKVEIRATEWAFERIREAFEKVAKDEAGILNIVQGIVLQSTDFLQRIIAPAGGQGGVTMSYLCPNCNSFLPEDHVWWVSAGKKHCSWWCAICGEICDWRAPNRLLVVQTGDSASQAKVFKAHAVPQGVCENLINALKLLANQQKDGDSPIQSIVTGLCERSRKGIMEGLRIFLLKLIMTVLWTWTI